MPVIELPPVTIGGLSVDPESACRLQWVLEDLLTDRIGHWPTYEPISLVEELEEVYAFAVLRWSGAQLDDVDRVVRDLTCVGRGWADVPSPARPLAQAARRLDRWALQQIDAQRSRASCPEGWPLAVLAGRRGLDGRHLGRRVAAANLVEVLRSAVAVAYVGTAAVRDLARGWQPWPADTDPDGVLELVSVLQRRYPGLVASGPLVEPLLVGTLAVAGKVPWAEPPRASRLAPNGVA